MRRFVPLEARIFFRGAPVINHSIGGMFAIRDGKWKLVARGETSDWELYDVGADRCETRDLAVLHSAVVERLSSAYDAWAERCHVVTPSEIKRIRDARKKRPKAPSKGR